jgi:hypothetical protein
MIANDSTHDYGGLNSLPTAPFPDLLIAAVP